MSEQELKCATFIEYTDNTFDDFHELVGADYGFIAMDLQEEKPKLIKHWPDALTPEEAEKDLRPLGYTLGLEA